ncbi:MAG: iron transporter [Alphaproteobacteria bacterium]|nr:MAG: iron transporter [Alphaproteobacteria bacterium]
MFIQTQAMPSPESLKFLPGCQVLAGGTVDLRDAAQAARSPLARRLFRIQGVSSVSLGADFITVTKEAGDWQVIRPAILGAIMDHFSSGAPVLEPAAAEAVEGGSKDLAEEITEALCRVIDPELGYNIVGLGLVYDVAIAAGGVARVTMTTTTRGCPATDYLMEGARDAAASVPGVEVVEVTLSYDPPWTPEMMSPEAKMRFGIRDGGGW